MYGKIFESLYEGSMVGKGAVMFAVWGYVIAHMRIDLKVGAQVELNPKLLGFILGENQGVVSDAIEKLCDPDPDSRSKEEGGRRLIKLGQYSYRVVNGAKYRAIRTAEERREYFREYKRRQRAMPRLEPLPEAERVAQHLEQMGDLDGARRCRELSQGLGVGEAS